MTRQEMAEAIQRVFNAFSCPEIAESVYLDEEFGTGDGATIAIQATDGTCFFVEVQDV